MKTIADLQAIREKMQAEIKSRESIDSESDIKIVVGMATCGIAAGARPVLSAFLEEIAKRGLKNVKVTQAGCLGMCKLEPMVEVFVPGKPKVTYIKVNSEIAKNIVANHIVNGNVVSEYLISNE